MFIVVAADDQSLESLVSEEFILCKYLLIVDMDKMKFIAVENEGDPLGEVLARKITEYNCEGVITGKLTPEAFEIIAGDGVTRFDGRGHSVKEALDLMAQRALKLIRNPEGTDDCGGDHSEGNCGGYLN
jgi:predicted Fe-Mo cluster-binding NifX family protein